jgi:acyl-CoA synthetase (AMP-forming)/AMP-acid ligase II
VTEIAAQPSVYHAFELAAKQYGRRSFLRVPAVSTRDYADDAIGYSYDQTRTRVDELLSGYATLDLSPGDRVAIAFDSRLEVYLHLLALNALGVSASARAQRARRQHCAAQFGRQR